MKRASAVITIFFSLLSAVFLSLTFTVTEAVRVSGARAHCMDLTVLGNWSVFSEYENRLLEDYSILAVDGSYGTGRFSINQVNTRLKKWLEGNAHASEGIREKMQWLVSDPFRVEVKDCKVSEYALLTDQNGEPFYQQAVDYMHSTAVMNSVSKLLDLKNKADEALVQENSYQERSESDSSLQDLQGTIRQREQEVQENALVPAGDVIIYDSSTPMVESNESRELRESKKIKNPVWTILSLKRKNILDLVCGSLKRSKQKIPGWDLVSKRSKHTGTLKIKAKYRSLTDDLLFREYLMDHYPNFRDGQDTSRLNYQIEYILAGTASDEKNLKKAVKRLLLLREAYNWLYLNQDSSSYWQTQTIAAAILGWTGQPELIEAFRQAILVCWSYGESLYDVRILMHGGRVPLMKTASDWHVPLSRLAYLDTDLQNADHQSGSGTAYEDYLRLLLNMQTISTQKKRALDLLELNLRKLPETEKFRADNCIVAVSDSASWTIPPVYSRVPGAFLGISQGTLTYNSESGFAY